MCARTRKQIVCAGVRVVTNANVQVSIASGCLWCLLIAAALQSAGAACSHGYCDTQFYTCCGSNNGNPVAPSCYTGCYICPPGSYSQTQYACLFCEVGTYSSSSASSSCTLCAAGTYADVKGLSIYVMSHVQQSNPAFHMDVE